MEKRINLKSKRLSYIFVNTYIILFSNDKAVCIILFSRFDFTT